MLAGCIGCPEGNGDSALFRSPQYSQSSNSALYFTTYNVTVSWFCVRYQKMQHCGYGTLHRCRNPPLGIKPCFYSSSYLWSTELLKVPHLYSVDTQRPREKCTNIPAVLKYTAWKKRWQAVFALTFWHAQSKSMQHYLMSVLTILFLATIQQK